MVESDEFRFQILPGLVATGTGMRSERPIFFLHVPKTGGTSVRLALGDAIGVPALNLYRAWPTPDRELHHYWPYWAGHAQIGFFPESHLGITLFREPRSRILSQYRQNQALRVRQPRHGWGYGRAPQRGPLQGRPFNEWLGRLEEHGRASMLHLFMPTDDPRPGRARTAEESRALLALDERTVVDGLRTAFRRFGAAAWIHREGDVLDAIERVTRHRPDALPRENVFEDKELVYDRVQLSRDHHEALERCARADGLVLRVAAEQGLIDPLSPDEADAILERTAARLGFDL